MFNRRTAARTPAQYIAALDEPRKTDIRKLHDLIRKEAPNLTPHLESGMLGYGSYHYRYATGREGDTFVIGLASNATYISLYVMAADEQGYLAESYKGRLPKASIGKSCIRFKRLSHLDERVLREVIRSAAAFARIGTPS